MEAQTAQLNSLYAFNTFFVDMVQQYAAYRNNLPEGEEPVEEDAFVASEVMRLKAFLMSENSRLSSQALPPLASAQQPPPGSQAPSSAPTPAPGSAATRTAHQSACPDGSRLAQRPATKAATIEASNSSSILAAADKAARIRKEARSDLLESRRESEESDAAAAGAPLT